MPTNLSIDDNNTTLIQYQGSWTYIQGSTRQWEGGVHATSQTGSSATFRFRGYQVWLWGTIPAGAGTNIIDIVIDSGSPSTVTRNSNGSAVYNEQYFVSPLLRDTYHTIVVTNRGDPSKNSEFMLDRFQFETEDEVPLFSTTGGTVSSTSLSSPSSSSYVSLNSPPSRTSSRSLTSSVSSPGTPSAVTFTSFVSLGASSSSPPFSSTQPSSQTSESKPPWGPIIGGIVACCVLLVAVIFLLFLWKKKTSNVKMPSPTDSPSPFTPTPFPFENRAVLNNLESPPSDRGFPAASNPNVVSEKGGYERLQHQPAIPASRRSASRRSLSGSGSTSALASSAATADPHPDAATGPSPSTPGNHPVDYHPTSTHDAPQASFDGEKYEHPPPSYWQNPVS